MGVERGRARWSRFAIRDEPGHAVRSTRRPPLCRLLRAGGLAIVGGARGLPMTKIAAMRNSEFGVRNHSAFRIPHSELPHGFTLVELLIAATMMSVLFIGLGGHLRGGIEVWRQTTQRVDALQRQRVTLDRLERDLANGIVYDARDEAYGVEEGEL